MKPMPTDPTGREPNVPALRPFWRGDFLGWLLRSCRLGLLRHRAVRWCLVALTLPLLAVIGAGLALPLVPLPPALFAPPRNSMEFLDRHGATLREVRDGEAPFRQEVAFAGIPQALVHATLAAEDKRFWDHSGLDVRAVARAAWGFVRHRRVISGGSTVTMQLIKQCAPRPRTLRTKLIETAQAMRLEQVWDKQRILAAYLNRVEYGHGNAGCAQAAEFFFGKPLRDLSVAECALLAGLPQAPSRLNPHRHFERARKRQQWILRRMRENGWLTGPELARASAEPLRLATPRRVFEAPHFVELVMQSGQTLTPALSHPMGEGARKTRVVTSKLWSRGETSHDPPSPVGRERAGVRATPITTTLDLPLNRFCERTLRHHLSRLASHQVRNGALVVLDNASGDVLALVGSEDYFAPEAGQVNGAWAPRSAGSTFKPFTYLLALERGATPATIVADVPVEFATSTGIFTPVNYNRHCYGPMRYRLALANSLNISAVKVLAEVGGAEVLQQRLQDCGLTTLTSPANHYGLGLTIGNAEARLLELANAYACLARLGEFKPFNLLAGAGLPARGGSRPGKRVCDAGAAFLIADVLSDNTARALAFGFESSLRFDFPVACKTGTSSDFRDNWAFGYTPEFTVGVWVGNFDGRPMEGISGVTGAAPLLHDVFEHLHERQGTSWYITPTNIVERLVHPVTGKRVAAPGASGPLTPVREKFLARALPAIESAEDYDEAGRVRLGVEYRDWVPGRDNWLGNRVVLVPSAAALRIVSPLPGTIFYLDPDLPDGGRRLPLRAEGSGELRWASDSLSCRPGKGQTEALLSEGRHRLIVTDAQSGARQETWIEVKSL